LVQRQSPYFSPTMAAETRQRLASLELPGVPMPRLNRPARPGVLSLTDAFQTADDFVIERTTRRSIDKFLQHFDWSSFDMEPQSWRLMLPTPMQETQVFHLLGDDFVPWLQFKVDASGGFRCRNGIELPVLGLQALLLSNGEVVVVPPVFS
jgi:hypothetical protein